MMKNSATSMFYCLASIHWKNISFEVKELNATIKNKKKFKLYQNFCEEKNWVSMEWPWVIYQSEDVF